MILKPVYSNRDFTIRENLHAIQSVDRLSWSCMGGPDQAEITATGPAAGVWELAEYLRYPVVIYDDKAQAVWYGYVHEVQINYGSLQWGVSMDSLYNSIAVAYSFVDTGSQSVGTRKTTSYLADTDSVATFGTKQLLQSASGMSDAAANSYRATLLASKKYPSGVVTPGTFGKGNPGVASASITCKGWWYTLDWKYAANPDTNTTDTIFQINYFVTTFGQFLTVADFEFTATGVTTSPYRDGDNTALTEIVSLLEMGNSASLRILASAKTNGRIYFYSEPPNTIIGAQMDRLGNLYDPRGNKTSIYNPPVGVWCELRDVLPSTVDTTRVINPTLQFIDGMEWTPENGLVPKFRGQMDLYDNLGGY